jgi:hypothetical protein
MFSRKKVLGAGSVIIVAIILLIVFYKLVGDGGPEVRLPLLSIGGIVVMLVVLALTSLSFAIAGLDDPKQALALPEGSIRAVIALSLIVLFSILSFYLYGSLSTGTIRTIANLGAPAKEDFVKKIGPERLMAVSEADPKGNFSVTFREDRNVAGDDFAKQLLVMMGTLVTSIASFYFGTKATLMQAADGSLKPAPTMRGISPPTHSKGPTPTAFTITGDNLDTVKEVKFTFGTSQVVASIAPSTSSTLTCNAIIDTPQPSGDWDVIASDAAGRSSKLSHALKVT